MLEPTPVAVRMTAIHKHFGAVAANANVDLTVRTGTVHGIVGENGAGKSTLMSILYGFYQADSGQIEVFGQSADIRNADDAIARGIGMVHQHFMLVDTLTALENVMLGAEPHWLLQRSDAQVRSKLNDLMVSTGLQIPLDSLVADLPVGDRQRLEILKTLYRGAKILILDEPTAVLTPQETTQLFGVLKRLREQGTTLILITHKLKEVMALCDVVTVMRAGQVVAELPIAEASVEGLAQAMVGRKVHMGRSADGAHQAGEVLLQAEHLSVTDSLGVFRLKDVSLSLRAGEMVGVAGVSGNGQSELMDVLTGLLTPDQGQLQVLGSAFEAPNWLNPSQARALGLAHVPEDRHARALVMAFAAWESAVLGYDDLPEYSHGGWMNHAHMQHATVDMMERFDVRPRDPLLPSSKFSGGNQQKLVLARELGRAPKVLLVGQPTRGVDIGAIEFIYTQLRALRQAGCAVLVVSSELDEILALSDRVLVMNQGRIAGELPIADCTEAALGLLMTGCQV
ncbi:ABC transporter ATP-binding protein [Rhodoferax fermentans]|uniref:Heme ABC transporter ATP-binding protein n=1 Tax=Rhodoferax fermentans TaxID=28066 RepID=A0A1T1AND2_RHOFE|nr:ABC transporter ATP-binding protein [Rhodoferax fermentans]MBK1684525.1 ABC transporter ATP-binding protein [Rhodoferax fermentans]OOV05547.1 heme ABC transporter ATP-binding protein [Rhodoferax fermentans]